MARFQLTKMKKYPRKSFAFIFVFPCVIFIKTYFPGVKQLYEYLRTKKPIKYSYGKISAHKNEKISKKIFCFYFCFSLCNFYKNIFPWSKTIVRIFANKKTYQIFFWQDFSSQK